MKLGEELIEEFEAVMRDDDSCNRYGFSGYSEARKAIIDAIDNCKSCADAYSRAYGNGLVSGAASMMSAAGIKIVGSPFSFQKDLHCALCSKVLEECDCDGSKPRKLTVGANFVDEFHDEVFRHFGQPEKTDAANELVNGLITAHAYALLVRSKYHKGGICDGILMDAESDFINKKWQVVCAINNLNNSSVEGGD